MESLEKSDQQRLEWLDAARAVAILAMILVHFTLVAAVDVDSGFSSWLLELLDGKAASTFLILTGIGMSLFVKQSASSLEVGKKRKILFKRGLLLLALGHLNLMVWQGDILRVYGISLVIMLPLLRCSMRCLLTCSFTFAVAFLLLFFTLDYGSHWNWNEMHYNSLWTAEGLLRNLFFDGFRSVLPWTGYIILGLALGRYYQSRSPNLKLVFISSLVLFILTEVASTIFVWTITAFEFMTKEDAVAIFGTRSMPPLPIFLASGIFAALAIISGAGVLSKYGLRWLITPLSSVGRMSLTWYILHIWFGLGTFVVLDATNSFSFGAAICLGIAFFLFAIIASILWERTVGRGPFEALVRKL